MHCCKTNVFMHNNCLQHIVEVFQSTTNVLIRVKRNVLLELNQGYVTGSTFRYTTIQHKYKTLTYNCVNIYMEIWNVRPILYPKNICKVQFPFPQPYKTNSIWHKQRVNSTHITNILINTTTLYILTGGYWSHHPLQKSPCSTFSSTLTTRAVH
jgi:hypothetical protein